MRSSDTNSSEDRAELSIEADPVEQEYLIHNQPGGQIKRRIEELVFDHPLPPAFVLIILVSTLFSGIIFLGLFKLINQHDLRNFVANPFVACVLSIPVGACAVFLLLGLLPPTHLGVSAEGLRWYWRRLPFLPPGKILPWSQVKQIKLVQPAGTTLPERQFIEFEPSRDDYSGVQRRSIAIQVGAIADSTERENLFKAISTFAPRVPKDISLGTLLCPPADSGYTELWLRALSGPPVRDRLIPLAADTWLRGGRYRVVRQIGMGGQGTAYMAEVKVEFSGARENEIVVLKEYILPVQVTRAAKTQAIERMQSEARLLESLCHRQIVRLLDFFVEDHRGYLVLEHLEGRSLKDAVRESPMEEGELISIAIQVCEILQYLHELTPPVVHRDLTPDNLVFTRTDLESGAQKIVKLIDFNVAYQVESSATAAVVGKHAYIPPEQFRGKPVPQSDIYALGATMYFLLTASDPEPLSISSPRELRPKISPALDSVCRKATAIRLEERFASAREMKAALEELLENGEINTK